MCGSLPFGENVNQSEITGTHGKLVNPKIEEKKLELTYFLLPWRSSHLTDLGRVQHKTIVLSSC